MKRRRLFLISITSLALIVGALLLFPATAEPRAASAEANAIPGRYVVQMKTGINPDLAASQFRLFHGFRSNVVYSHSLHGFSAEMSAADAQALTDNPAVASVQQDSMLSIDNLYPNPYQTVPTGLRRIGDDENTTAHITNAPNGTSLDVDVAVIDTGVVTDHPDLNVAGGAGFTGPNCSSSSYEDDNGHGSHVAGTIAARDDDRGIVGVAPGARIWAVKVLDASGAGPDSCVIAGIDWVTNRRAEYNDGAGDGDPGIDITVANMSLGGQSGYAPNDDVLCQAINASVAVGVMYAVAAGNDNADAGGYSPAKCYSAVAVSAFGDYDGKGGGLSHVTTSCSGSRVTKDDSFACFSNWGPSVDIAAPGINILSTFIHNPNSCGNDPCYTTMSGTSMASPHVAGALALLVAAGYRDRADATSAMYALSNAGYLRPQSSACGFSGDSDVVREPVLYLGTTCTSGPSPSPTRPPTLPPTVTSVHSPTASPTLTPTQTAVNPTFSPTPTPSTISTASASVTTRPSPPPAPTESPTPTTKASATPTPIPTSGPSASPAPTVGPGMGGTGDVDCDKKLTAKDAIDILLIVAHLQTNAKCPAASAANCEPGTDVGDLVSVMQALAGIKALPDFCAASD